MSPPFLFQCALTANIFVARRPENVMPFLIGFRLRYGKERCATTIRFLEIGTSVLSRGLSNSF